MARKKKDTGTTPVKKEDKLLGQCLYCHEAVMKSHDHGYVKQKGVTGKKYFHTRCMEPTIGQNKRKYPNIPDDRTDCGLLSED